MMATGIDTWVLAFFFGCLGLTSLLLLAPTPHTTSVCLSSRLATGGFLEYPEEAWMRLVAIHQRQAKKQRHPKSYNSSEPTSKWFQNNFEPDFHCIFEERIGRAGDGGKWVCDPLALRDRPCLVYSLGSNGDFSFETSMIAAAPNCKIHTFDMADYTQAAPPGVTFHPFGVRGPSASKDPKYKDLETIRKELGHSRIDIMKMDIEGAEFATLTPILLRSPRASLPRQILIEIHGGRASSKHRQLFEAFYKAGYVIFHKEPNTLGCGGSCIEYAWLLADMKAHC